MRPKTDLCLVPLLPKHGRRDEARAMLADIYNWFTEASTQ